MPIKKISAEEAARLKQRPLGKKHAVHIAIEQMEPGDILQIGRDAFSWKGKTPQIFCKRISKNSSKRFAVSWLADKSGWIVERVDEKGVEKKK